MGGFREYIMVLITASVIKTLASLMVDDARTYGKYIKWMASLIFIIIMISPVKDAVVRIMAYAAECDYDIKYGGGAGSFAENALIDESIAQIEANIGEALLRGFGVDNCDIGITADRSDISNVRLSCAEIELINESDTRKKDDIGRYVSNLLECKAVVICLGERTVYEFSR